MERPVSGQEAFLEWQDRLKRFEASEMSLDAFCQQENTTRAKFVDWLLVLKHKPPQPTAVESEAEEESAGGPAFVPVSVKASAVEIELPNGGRVRLPASIGRAVLTEIIRIVGDLPQETQA